MNFECRKEDKTITFQAISPHGGNSDLFATNRMPITFRKRDPRNFSIHDEKGQSYIRDPLRQVSIHYYHSGYSGPVMKPCKVIKKSQIVNGSKAVIRKRSDVTPWNSRRHTWWRLDGLVDRIEVKDDACLLVKDSLYKDVQINVSGFGVIAFTCGIHRLAMKLNEDAVANMRFALTRKASVRLQGRGQCIDMFVEKRALVRASENSQGDFYGNHASAFSVKSEKTARVNVISISPHGNRKASRGLGPDRGACGKKAS
jgi:hypothetical protein